jgi:imidazolonepropionase-like amidohydrolase
MDPSTPVPLQSLRTLAVLVPCALWSGHLAAQQPEARDTSRPVVLVPAAVWDGVADAPARGWVVVVRGARIAAVGPAERVEVPSGAERVELAGATLIPVLI